VAEELLSLLSPHQLAYLKKLDAPRYYTLREELVLHRSLLCTLRTFEYQWFIDTSSELVYDLCMMPMMVKEADLNRIDVPEER
jgi:hypothetical protein